MLNLYQSLDPRVGRLCMLVKLWGKMKGTSGGKRNFLSSYAYNLMVIFFLQRIEPPILPSLQRLAHSEGFKQFEREPITITRDVKGEVETFVTDVSYVDDEALVRRWMDANMNKNKFDTIHLLRFFFHFYGTTYIGQGLPTLSIRVAGYVNRKSEEENYLISIEDPFDVRHNPGNKISMKETKASRVAEEMRKAYESLCLGDVGAVFSPVADKPKNVYSNNNSNKTDWRSQPANVNKVIIEQIAKKFGI